MRGGKNKRARNRLNIDHFLDFFSINLDGAVINLQLKESVRMKMLLDFLDFFLFLFFSCLLCLAFDAFFDPALPGGGVDLPEDVDDDFLADLEAVLRAVFFVVFLDGIVA